MDTTMIGYTITKTCEHILVEEVEINEGKDSAGTHVYTSIVNTTKCVRCGHVDSVRVYILDNA